MSVCLDYSSTSHLEKQLAHGSLLEKINERQTSADKFFSLEFYPPRTRNGACNLLEKCDRLAEGRPLFCDVACDLKTNDHGEIKENKSITIASATQDLFGVETMLQLDCARLTEYKALGLLQQAKALGLRNILIMKEAPKSKEELRQSSANADFKNSVELVQFVRRKFGNYFTVCVAGYPSTMTNDDMIYEESLDHLKAEAAAGADFVITQMVFQAEMLIAFIKQCRGLGITVPIIPGILPIQSYSCIKQLRKQASIDIPKNVMNILNPIKDNDEAVLRYGTYLTVQLCKALLETALVCGLHFYTLNRETATKDILKRIGLWKDECVPRRVLPWQQCEENEERAMLENVRPIFWALRPDSYVHRTSQWENFPNGRWGDSSCSAFGRFSDYHLFFAKNRDRLPELKRMWGDSIDSEQDVFDVFASFISGSPNRNGVKVSTIPWTEEDIALETGVIRDRLVHLNRNGILTINSQPNVNCLPSSDKIFGWGSPGGYVFQKAYLEFFANKEDTMNLLALLQDYPSVNYHIINRLGNENHSNADRESPNAVTWGVFTGRPILQPTVVDPQAFTVWKDEAFELWMLQWGRLYAIGSKSQEIIKKFHNSYYLVNLVDNDYVKGNCLFDVVDKVISMRGS